MVTQAPRRSAVAMALLFILTCFGLIVFVWGKFGGTLPLEPKGYEIHAQFLQASQLTANADVRIAGVSVGRVVRVAPLGQRTDATIRLDAPYAPLPADARAILRQKTLLGETFVALTPGSPSAPKLAEGASLPVRNVAGTVQLDTVLGSFDPPTQRNLQKLLRGLAQGLDGRGEDLNAALGNLDPATARLGDLVRVLDGQRGAVRRTIRETGTVLQTVADRRADLGRLLGDGADVLDTTAARDRQLTATIDALPALLAELRRTLAQVDVTARHAAPSLAALRPVAPLLRPALDDLVSVAPAVQQTFRRFDPLITTSITALPAVRKLLTAVGPFVDQLDATASQVTPQIDYIDSYGRDLSGYFANIAAATQASVPRLDGNGRVHVLRTGLVLSNQSLVGAGRRTASNRHNAYPAPGVLDAVGGAGLPASDCRNTGNPEPLPPAQNVPCRVAGPRSTTGTYYPHLTALPATPHKGRR